MSSGLKLDRADTAYAEKAHELSLKNRNWLRHGSKTSAGKIDEMLFDGATIEQTGKGSKDDEGNRVCSSDSFEEGSQAGYYQEGWGVQV